MHAPQHPRAVQDGEVAPDRLGSDVVGLRQLGHRGTALADHQRGDRLLTLFGIHEAPFMWVSARIDLVMIGFTTVRVDLSRNTCNLVHMTAAIPLTTHFPAGTVLRGVP